MVKFCELCIPQIWHHAALSTPMLKAASILSFGDKVVIFVWINASSQRIYGNTYLVLDSKCSSMESLLEINNIHWEVLWSAHWRKYSSCSVGHCHTTDFFCCREGMDTGLGSSEVLFSGSGVSDDGCQMELPRCRLSSSSSRSPGLSGLPPCGSSVSQRLTLTSFPPPPSTLLHMFICSQDCLNLCSLLNYSLEIGME